MKTRDTIQSFSDPLDAFVPEGAVEAYRGEPSNVNRRKFIKLSGVAGGGLVLAFTLMPKLGIYDADAKEMAKGKSGDVDLNAYIQVHPDGTIRIYSKNPEIGQGIKTGLPMIVAEELDAPWSKVIVEQAPIDPKRFGAQFAGGSLSTPFNFQPMRVAGATARAMLVAAAAKEWKVPASEITTSEAMLMHAGKGKKASYAEMAEKAAKMPVPDPKTLKFKDRKDWKLLGTRVTGVDNHAIVTGGSLFGIDMVVPGMLYATYTKGPAVGAKVKSANLDHIKTLPGVKDAFVLPGNGTMMAFNPGGETYLPGVAIVAESTWAAISAKRQLEVQWDETNASKDSWKGFVSQAAELAKQGGGKQTDNKGNVDDAMKSAKATAEGYYTFAYVSHAHLEPHNCTASFKDGKLEVWAPTQTPTNAIPGVAKLLGISPADVTLHQRRCGGGFGRRLENDYVREAAMISKQIGAPVKLQWTREDDFAHDYYRPGGFFNMKGAVDQDGKASAWEAHVITMTPDGKMPVSAGGLNPLNFPKDMVGNYRVTQSMMMSGTPTGPWRAPGSNTWAWVEQSFVHEMAVAAGRDHVEFLLEMMGKPRQLMGAGRPGPGGGGPVPALNTGRAAAVIKLAAEKSGWGRTMPKGRGLGLAFFYSHMGHIAEAAEVSVDANNKVRVHKIWVVGDIGPVINMSAAENEFEGAAIDGLSTMMGLEVTMENGRIQQRNFDAYPILRIEHAPEVEVTFLQTNNNPTGAGEPALPPLAPAVCNAIYAATGRRIRTLPISTEGFSI